MPRMVDARCRLCGKTSETLQRDTGFIDRCECGGERERLYTDSISRAVRGDDIPGGMTFKHGICYEDGTPRTFYSKQAIKDAYEKAGLLPMQETGQQIPVTDDETADNFKRRGYEQASRWMTAPAILSPEQEAERVRHWHEHETQLQQEMKSHD